MPKFAVLTDYAGETIEVDAEYHVVEDNLLTFKTNDHKQVAAFSVHRIVSVTRIEGAPVSIGHVTVKVTPQIDEAEWRAVIDRAAKRSGGGVTLA